MHSAITSTQYSQLTPALVLLGALCLIAAPHFAVTRIDHCGMRITLHMMEYYWTAIFSAAAVTGAACFYYARNNLLALVGIASATYAIVVLAQIRLWYSYQEVPEQLDLMQKIFGHVMDIGLPVAMLGGLLFVAASLTYRENPGTNNKVD